jgi:hypothetical protein
LLYISPHALHDRQGKKASFDRMLEAAKHDGVMLAELLKQPG